MLTVSLYTSWTDVPKLLTLPNFPLAVHDLLNILMSNLKVGWTIQKMKEDELLSYSQMAKYQLNTQLSFISPESHTPNFKASFVKIYR